MAVVGYEKVLVVSKEYGRSELNERDIPSDSDRQKALRRLSS